MREKKRGGEKRTIFGTHGKTDTRTEAHIKVVSTYVSIPQGEKFRVTHSTVVLLIHESKNLSSSKLSKQ